MCSKLKKMISSTLCSWDPKKERQTKKQKRSIGTVISVSVYYLNLLMWFPDVGTIEFLDSYRCLINYK